MSGISRRSLIIAAGTSGALAATTAHSKEAAPMSRLYTVMQAIITAWRTQDVEGVLSHVTDDIVWQNSSGYAEPILGKAAMREALNVMGPKIKTSRWRIFDHIESGDRLFVEGVDEFWTKDGAHIAIPYAGSMHFRGSLVHDWREFFDGRLSAEQRALGVTKHLETLIQQPVAK